VYVCGEESTRRKCSEENGEVVSSICWKKDTRENKWGRNELGEVGTDRQTDRQHTVVAAAATTTTTATNSS
jgi:hypothetical protein